MSTFLLYGMYNWAFLSHHTGTGAIFKADSFSLSTPTPKIVIMRATLKQVASMDVSA